MTKASEFDARETIRRMQKEFPKEGICGAEVSVSMGYAIKSDQESVADVMRRAYKMMYAQKITESAKMKEHTAENIIEMAKKEGLIKPLSPTEDLLLDHFLLRLYPEGEEMLKKGYEIRKLGLCSLFYVGRSDKNTLNRRHTETSYRVLSVMEEYHSVAGYVLHSTEHWDGSGWPAGLSGHDIPLPSRIMAVVDAFMSGEDGMAELERHSRWFDPKLVSLCREIIRKENL